MGSLRRTALKRRPELRRTPMPRKRPRAPKTLAGRRRDTGPTAATRRKVHERAGWCCEVCGKQLHDGTAWTKPHAIHHRRPRGAGGSSAADMNSPANLLLVCGTGNENPDTCHGLIESQRAMAYGNGWLLHQHDDPVTVPVLIAGGVRVHLNQEGQYTP